jgi:hypothetical protein
MRRAIQRLIQDPLSLKLINGDFHEGETILADRDGEALSFSVITPVPHPAEPVGAGHGRPESR